MEKAYSRLSVDPVPGPSSCRSTSSRRADPNTARPSRQSPSAPGRSSGSSACPATTSRSSPTTDYYGKGPISSALVFKYIPDLTVLYTQFQTGDIDYIGLQGISPDHYEEAKKLPDRKIIAGAAALHREHRLQSRQPAVQGKAVREALYYAIDKKASSTRSITACRARPSPICRTQAWAYNPDLPKHEYDPAKAKKILDEPAGSPAPTASARRTACGSPSPTRPRPATTCASRRSSSCSRPAGDRRRDDDQQHAGRGDVGRLLDAVEIRHRDGRPRLHDRPRPRRAPTTSPATSIGAKGGAGQNTMQYDNPEVDTLLAEGADDARSGEAQGDLLASCRSIIRNDLPYLPIFQYAVVEGTKAGLKGYEPNINVQINTLEHRRLVLGDLIAAPAASRGMPPADRSARGQRIGGHLLKRCCRSCCCCCSSR